MKTTKTILLVRFNSTRVQLLEVTNLADSGFEKHVTYNILQDRKVIRSGMWSRTAAIFEVRQLIFKHSHDI